MEERFAVGLIVNNRFGVLDRIAGLYAKRCYNIDAISAGPTENPEYTRLTIVSTGDEYMKDHIEAKHTSSLPSFGALRRDNTPTAACLILLCSCSRVS